MLYILQGSAEQMFKIWRDERERKLWRRQGPDLQSGAAFSPSGLRLKRHHRTMELNGYQPQRLFFLTFFSFFFYSLEYQKVPHVSASGQKISGVRQRKRNTISNGRERESFNWEEEMEREERKERRLGSLSTSVQRRLLIMGLRLMAGLQLLLMEQLKCGLTTCSRSHAKVPYNIDEKKKKSFERILQLQLRLWHFFLKCMKEKDLDCNVQSIWGFFKAKKPPLKHTWELRKTKT